MNLSSFQKPSRYIDCEINSIKKDAEVRTALVFPDIYDVGMSHLGLRILYKIINDIPYASAERVFHPWLDMEEAIKSGKAPLCSLESKRRLMDFDILGFSLQYELSYTSVLNMLMMGGIPLRAAQRTEGHPLVIAGGPCTVNPMPMSPFMDAFLVGDGEEAVREILETYRLWKKEGDGKRHSLLKALGGIEGIYVPSIGNRAGRRVISDLDSAPYPESPIVPFTSIVHDRVNIEVSRGCAMGCRFCQAGMIQRPLRERSPQRVLRIAEESLKNTGYEEVSFTSLSAGDYSCLEPLIKEFNRRFAGRMLSVSLPSVRVKAINAEILKGIRSVRKTGFTIAPEAATERLRAVINKDFSDEDFERAIELLFSEGWLNLKLYYMTGLPSERDEDIEAIPEMAMKALRAAKRHTRRFVNINVAISPFVPKPHTPFQWCAQEPVSEMRRKKAYLRTRLRKKGLNVKEHNEEMSMLEAAFSRGDERLALLLEAAVKEGARLEGWSEAFDMAKWMRAMERTSIDAASYAQRSFGPEEPLPWDNIETGIEKDFLKKEYNLALEGKTTEECAKECSACGLGCPKPSEAADFRAKTPKTVETSRGISRPLRLRLEFGKTGPMRYLSHRELMTHIMRSIRRAGIHLAYTQGFHPTPKLSFGPPLGVGISGLREYFDMDIARPTDLKEMTRAINDCLAEGITISEARAISPKAESLQSFISRYEYEIICDDMAAVEDFVRQKEVLASREKGPVDIRAMVEHAARSGENRVRLMLRDVGDNKVRLDEVLREVFRVPPEELDVTRVSLYGLNGGWRNPMGETH